jgi:hypothetical protein
MSGSAESGGICRNRVSVPNHPEWACREGALGRVAALWSGRRWRTPSRRRRHATPTDARVIDREVTVALRDSRQNVGSGRSCAGGLLHELFRDLPPLIGAVSKSAMSRLRDADAYYGIEHHSRVGRIRLEKNGMLLVPPRPVLREDSSCERFIPTRNRPHSHPERQHPTDLIACAG